MPCLGASPPDGENPTDACRGAARSHWDAVRSGHGGARHPGGGDLPKLRHHEYELHVPRVRDVLGGPQHHGGLSRAPARPGDRSPSEPWEPRLSFARRRETPRVDGLSDIMLSDNPRSTGRGAAYKVPLRSSTRRAAAADGLLTPCERDGCDVTGRSGGTTALQPIPRISLKDAIIERLGQLIDQEQIRPGARLPPELTLARALRVSRSSIPSSSTSSTTSRTSYSGRIARSPSPAGSARAPSPTTSASPPRSAAGRRARRAGSCCNTWTTSSGAPISCSARASVAGRRGRDPAARRECSGASQSNAQGGQKGARGIERSPPITAWVAD
jgi:hypothetical protein